LNSSIEFQKIYKHSISITYYSKILLKIKIYINRKIQ